MKLIITSLIIIAALLLYVRQPHRDLYLVAQNTVPVYETQNDAVVLPSSKATLKLVKPQRV